MEIINILQTTDDLVTRDWITAHYAFDARQTNYYTDAARYLGLLSKTFDEEGNVAYELTAFGVSAASKAPQKRNLAVAGRILSLKVFRQTMQEYLRTGEVPPASVVVKFILQERPDLTGTTPTRRASTVRAWVRWIVSLIGDE